MRKVLAALVLVGFGLMGSKPVVAFSNNMTGFYIGPSLGYAVGSVKTKYINPSILPPSLQNINDDAGLFGPFAGLQAGYQKDTGAMVIGGELYMSFGSVQGTLKDNGLPITLPANITPLLNSLLASKIKTTRNFGFGGAFKLGAKMNKIVFYGKVALDFSNFKMKIQNGVFKGTNSKYLFGMGPGLGVEGLVSKSLILGAEWTMLMYQSKSFFNQLQGVPVTAKLKPIVAEFKIRLNVKI
jgi:hypothetical protein